MCFWLLTASCQSFGKVSIRVSIICHHWQFLLASLAPKKVKTSTHLTFSPVNPPSFMSSPIVLMPNWLHPCCLECCPVSTPCNILSNQSEAADQQSSSISVYLVLELNWLINCMETKWTPKSTRMLVFAESSLPHFQVRGTRVRVLRFCLRLLPMDNKRSQSAFRPQRSNVSCTQNRCENSGIRKGKRWKKFAIYMFHTCSIHFHVSSVESIRPTEASKNQAVLPDALSRLGGKDHLLTSRWIWSSAIPKSKHQGLLENGLYLAKLQFQRVKWWFIDQPPNFSIFWIQFDQWCSSLFPWLFNTRACRPSGHLGHFTLKCVHVTTLHQLVDHLPLGFPWFLYDIMI